MGFFSKKHIGSPIKGFWVSKKAQGSMFVVEPREMVRVPETFEIWGFSKNRWKFSTKKLKNFKMAKGKQMSVEWE